MTRVKAGEVDAFLAAPPEAICCALLYGPDHGLVQERAAALAARLAEGGDDPFGLVRLEGDDLASDPARLLDEAHTVPLFGGRRVIRLRAGGRPIHGAVQALLDGPPPAAFVVVEAGDLKKSAPLRTLCEASRRAAALPCYADEGAGLARLVDQELADAGMAIDRDARVALLGMLGSDRLAIRQEMAKLILHGHAAGRITLADVDAVISDLGALALDDVVDAAFGGRPDALDRLLQMLDAEGTPAAAALAAATGFALRLYRLRIDVETGAAAGPALERAWPNLHFRRRDLVRSALSRWSRTRLDGVLARLAEAQLATRRNAALGNAIASRTLMVIAQDARRG